MTVDVKVERNPMPIKSVTLTLDAETASVVALMCGLGNAYVNSLPRGLRFVGDVQEKAFPVAIALHDAGVDYY